MQVSVNICITASNVTKTFSSRPRQDQDLSLQDRDQNQDLSLQDQDHDLCLQDQDQDLKTLTRQCQDRPSGICPLLL